MISKGELTFVVTGATRGLGLHTAVALLAQGHRVIAGARRPDAVVSAVRRLMPGVRQGQLEPLRLDFEDLSTVRCFAETLVARRTAVDGLINNAGVCCWREKLTVDGLERTFAVNYFGPFVLTGALLPLLRMSTAPRVVNIASMLHAQRLSFEDLQSRCPYRMTRAYCASKLMMMMHAAYLSRLHPWLTAISVHPGVLRTALGTGNVFGWLAARVGRFFAEAPFVGAQRVVSLALGVQGDVVRGGYYDKLCLVGLPEFAASALRQDELISRSDALAIRLRLRAQAAGSASSLPRAPHLNQCEPGTRPEEVA